MLIREQYLNGLSAFESNMEAMQSVAADNYVRWQAAAADANFWFAVAFASWAAIPLVFMLGLFFPWR